MSGSAPWPQTGFISYKNLLRLNHPELFEDGKEPTIESVTHAEDGVIEMVVKPAPGTHPAKTHFLIEEATREEK